MEIRCGIVKKIKNQYGFANLAYDNTGNYKHDIFDDYFHISCISQADLQYNAFDGVSLKSVFQEGFSVIVALTKNHKISKLYSASYLIANQNDAQLQDYVCALLSCINSDNGYKWFIEDHYPYGLKDPYYFKECFNPKINFPHILSRYYKGVYIMDLRWYTHGVEHVVLDYFGEKITDLNSWLNAFEKPIVLPFHSSDMFKWYNRKSGFSDVGQNLFHAFTKRFVNELKAENWEGSIFFRLFNVYRNPPHLWKYEELSTNGFISYGGDVLKKYTINKPSKGLVKKLAFLTESFLTESKYDQLLKIPEANKNHFGQYWDQLDINKNMQQRPTIVELVRKCLDDCNDFLQTHPPEQFGAFKLAAHNEYMNQIGNLIVMLDTDYPSNEEFIQNRLLVEEYGYKQPPRPEFYGR